MNYEIVKMESKVFAGVSDITSNSSPDMGEKISALWLKLYGGTAQKMKNRVNEKAAGLYCDYQENGNYTVLAGCEIEPSKAKEAKDEGLDVKTIPGGSYAKFIIHGDVKKAVGEAWEEIGKLPLKRTFTGDYEEYQEDCDGKSGSIIIYIAVNQEINEDGKSI